VPALLDGRPFTVLDISVEGSLGLFDVELRIGGQHPFRLGADGDAIDLTAHIMRVTNSSRHGRWITAVTFTGSPPSQTAALIARLLREHRR
jgi:hypothetical protein